MGDNSDKKKKKTTCVSYFSMRNPCMKFQNPSMILDERTDGQPETNMPRQLRQSLGHNKC